jgi:hypothetical protein
MKKFKFKMKYLVISIILIIVSLIGVLVNQQNQVLREQEKVVFDKLLTNKMKKEYEARIKEPAETNGLDSSVTSVQQGDYVEAKFKGTVYRSPEGGGEEAPQPLEETDLKEYISVVDLGNASVIRNISIGAEIDQDYVSYLKLTGSSNLSHVIFNAKKIYRLNSDIQDTIYKEAQNELPAAVDAERTKSKEQQSQQPKLQ